MPTATDFRRLVLGLAGAIEGAHMGHPDFRVNGRIFATLHADLRTGMVNLPLDEQARVVREWPDAFSPESGAWGRAGCTRVQLGSVDEETLGEALTIAWQKISTLPAAKRRATKPRAKQPVKRAGSARKR